MRRIFLRNYFSLVFFLVLFCSFVLSGWIRNMLVRGNRMDAMLAWDRWDEGDKGIRSATRRGTSGTDT